MVLKMNKYRSNRQGCHIKSKFSAFSFVFIQLVAGIAAIYGNIDVRYWSQFFRAIAYIFANCQDCRILCAIAFTCCHKFAKNAHKQLSYRGVQKGSTTVSALAQICDPDNCIVYNNVY